MRYAVRRMGFSIDSLLVLVVLLLALAVAAIQSNRGAIARQRARRRAARRRGYLR